MVALYSAGLGQFLSLDYVSALANCLTKNTRSVLDIAW